MRSKRLAFRAAVVASVVGLLGLLAAISFWQDVLDRDRTAEVSLAVRSSQLATQAALLAERSLSEGPRATSDDLTFTLRMMASSEDPDERHFGTWALQYLAPAWAEAPAGAYEAAAASLNAGAPWLPQVSVAPRTTASIEDPARALRQVGSVVLVANAGTRAQAELRALGGLEQVQGAQQVLRPLLFVVRVAVGVGLAALVLIFASRVQRSRADSARLRRMAVTDALTTLGNRRGFEESLGRLTMAGHAVSLLLLDLDEFKEVNDSLGHARGDDVLRQFARILRNASPAGAQPFRIGGDEFAVVLHGVDAAGARELAERIRETTARELGAAVTASVGVSSVGEGQSDQSLLQRQADIALYEAKLRGRNVVVAYSPGTMGLRLFSAAKIAAVKALAVEGRIDAVFQPITGLDSRIIGYEALSRPDPGYGLAGPSEAFEIAEQIGNAAELDRACRTAICAAAANLPAGATVFINISPHSLTHHGFVAAALVDELARAGLDCSRVVLEVTEVSRVRPQSIAAALADLRTGGVRIALDDVGSGNNGLELLRRVPVDYVKVDRAVIDAAMEGPPGRAALMAILAFASEARSVVIAEGIDNESTLAFVRSLGEREQAPKMLIHGVQGFYVGRPAPAAVLSVPTAA